MIRKTTIAVAAVAMIVSTGAFAQGMDKGASGASGMDSPASTSVNLPAVNDRDSPADRGHDHDRQVPFCH